MRDSMDGMYDDNFYFNNPVDHMANQNDPWFLHQLASCDIHLATGCGPWEVPGPTYQMSAVLASRGIGHASPPVESPADAIRDSRIAIELPRFWSIEQSPFPNCLLDCGACKAVR